MNIPSVNVVLWMPKPGFSSRGTVCLGVYDSYAAAENEKFRHVNSNPAYWENGEWYISPSFWIRNENDDILYGDLQTQDQVEAAGGVV